MGRVDNDPVNRRTDPLEPVAIPEPLTDLLTPRGRTAIVDTILDDPGRSWTAAEVCERAGMDPSTFNEHIEALLDAGFVVKGAKKGNAQTYAPDLENPVVGALQMVRALYRDGITLNHLSDDVVIDSVGELAASVDVCPRCGEDAEEYSIGPSGVACPNCI